MENDITASEMATESRKAYASGEVKKLDEWARGFLVGILFGVFFTVGLLLAITERLG